MTIRVNTPFIIHSYHFFQLKIFNLEKKDKKKTNYKKKTNKKIKKITWKTTNILPIHLQNQSSPINNHSLIIESKNRLHRQCEAYDDY